MLCAARTDLNVELLERLVLDATLAAVEALTKRALAGGAGAAAARVIAHVARSAVRERLRDAPEMKREEFRAGVATRNASAALSALAAIAALALNAATGATRDASVDARAWDRACALAGQDAAPDWTVWRTASALVSAWLERHCRELHSSIVAKMAGKCDWRLGLDVALAESKAYADTLTLLCTRLADEPRSAPAVSDAADDALPPLEMDASLEADRAGAVPGEAAPRRSSGVGAAVARAQSAAASGEASSSSTLTPMIQLRSRRLSAVRAKILLAHPYLTVKQASERTLGRSAREGAPGGLVSVTSARARGRLRPLSQMTGSRFSQGDLFQVTKKPGHQRRRDTKGPPIKPDGPAPHLGR